MLEIISNGNKWANTDTPWRTIEPESIESLIEVLGKYPLDPRFEKYGNFVNPAPEFIKPEAKIKYAGCTSFFGNFYTLSHVFNIYTDEPEIIDRLSKAIEANIATKEYKQARKEHQAHEKQVEQELKERLLKLRRAM